jgi:hypothetical protein
VSTASRIQSAVTNGNASFIHCWDATVRSYLYNITGLTISICIDTIWSWTNRSEQRRTVRRVRSQATECSVMDTSYWLARQHKALTHIVVMSLTPRSVRHYRSIRTHHITHAIRHHLILLHELWLCEQYY